MNLREVKEKHKRSLHYTILAMLSLVFVAHVMGLEKAIVSAAAAVHVLDKLIEL